MRPNRPLPPAAAARQPHMTAVHSLGSPSTKPPETGWPTPPDGWHAGNTQQTGPRAPNPPTLTALAAVADGTTGKLAVYWSAPATDATHDAASGYNLRFSIAGANTWTTIAGATPGQLLTALAAATSYDVEVQATNAAASPSAWSAKLAASTYGVSITWGSWTAGSSQTHGAAVAPNGGVNFFAVAAPTTPAAQVLAWSASNTTPPSSGFITAGSTGTTNQFGNWFNAPSSTGTFYLWAMSNDGSGNVIGALASGAIVVA